MVQKWMIVIVGFSLIASVGVRAQGGGVGQPSPPSQDTMAQDKMVKPMPTTVTYTGCIEAGKQTGTYMLTHAEADRGMKTGAMGKDALAKDATGKDMGKDAMGSMMLMGDQVDLSKHVGHRVAVTGMMGDSGKSGAMNKGAVGKDAMAKPTGGITVTSLKMVGTTCGM